MSRLGLFAVLLIGCHVLFEGVAAQAENSNRLRFRLPTNVEPSHYDLTLTPDLKAFTFTGKVTINLKVVEETNNLILNAKYLNVSEVTLMNDKKVIAHDEVKKNEEEELLIIPFSSKLPKGDKYVLSMNFVGELNDKKRGFYRSRYFDAEYKLHYIATTHFEPTGARWAFPCWDEPAFKATFQVTLKHPSNTRAISNTNQKGESTTEGDKKVSVFEVTPKMSTYLVAFVVSDYEVVENAAKTFRVWTKPSAVEEAKYALETGEKLMGILDGYTGIKYSDKMKKMDQISIKDFSAGAMENWGLVTYRETALLYNKDVTPIRTKQSITTVIAHEFSHQWFGNLVSPKWWKYIWLNEGFADYLQYFISHELIPEWRLNETFVVDNTQGNAFIADASKTIRPMNHDAQTPSEISKLFDSIAYQKSGAVIRMMSHILSDKKLREGLTAYLTKYSSSVAESENLLKVLQETTKWSWGNASFEQVMDAWVNKPGYPVLNVMRQENGKLKLTQERFLADGTTDDTKWWIPLTYTVADSVDFTNTTPADWLQPTEESKEIEVGDKDKWILFNKLQTGYYRVNYDENNWAKLDEALKKEKDAIVPVNRAQLIDDSLNLARANRLKYNVALSLTNYLSKEDDYVPWNAAFRSLTFLQSMLRDSKNYELFKSYVKYITQTLVKNVKIEPQQNDTDLQALLRVNLLKWSCKVGLDECKTYVEKEFTGWLGNGTALDVNLKNNIICAGLRSADEDRWNKTKAKLEEIKDEDERKSQLTLLACSESKQILTNFINSTLEEGSQLSFSSALQSVVSEHNEGVDIAIDFMKSEYPRIKKLNNAVDEIASATQAIANAVTKESQYIWLHRFVARQGLKADELQNLAYKASVNMDWIDSHGQEVEKWLTDNQELFKSGASSVAFASLLLVLSVFITRLF